MIRLSPGRAESRGATLLEVLISAGLMGLVAMGVYYVMSAGLRYVRVTNATIDVQRRCMLALVGLTRELGESSPRSFFSDGTGLTFASPRDNLGALRYDLGSRLLWQKCVAYYVTPVEGIPCLVRVEKALPKPVAKVPDPVPLSTMRAEITEKPRIISRDIVSFTTSTTSPVELSATAAITDGERDFKVTITSKVTLKN